MVQFPAMMLCLFSNLLGPMACWKSQLKVVGSHLFSSFFSECGSPSAVTLVPPPVGALQPVSTSQKLDSLATTYLFQAWSKCSNSLHLYLLFWVAGKVLMHWRVYLFMNLNFPLVLFLFFYPFIAKPLELREYFKAWTQYAIILKDKIFVLNII